MEENVFNKIFIKRRTVFRMFFFFFLTILFYFLIPKGQVQAARDCDCGTDSKYCSTCSDWQSCVDEFGCCGCYGWGDCDGSCYDVDYNPNGGSCQYTHWVVQEKNWVSPGTCTRSGYNLTGFTREYGCGTLNTSNGGISGVTCDTKIKANWEVACTNCGDCDPYSSPGCPTYYTDTNTGCSSTEISCKAYDSCGEHCDTNYENCHLVKYVVNFYAASGGYIRNTATNVSSTSDSQNVCRWGNSTYVEARPYSGYLFTNWSDGVTSATRRVTNVTSNTSRTAYFCNNSSCNPSCSLWPWTAESGFAYYGNVGCTNDCGTPDTVSCYCTTPCEPPNCPEGTSTGGEGDLYDISETTCVDDYCHEPNTRYCYYDCDTTSCADLVSDVEWLDTCPSADPNDCTETTQEITIGGAAPGCPSSETKTCYILNNEPELLSVNTEPSGAILDFTSSTYSGTQLNNPIKVTAQYADADGQEDIKAIYLWWSSSEAKDFKTPNRIANSTEGLTGQTLNNENFGFMITRDDSGTWSKFYIPYVVTDDSAWIEAGTVDETVTILGKDGDPLSRVQRLNLISTDANTVSLEINMEFLNNEINGANLEEIVAENYNIWGLANDVVGFLPFEDDRDIENSEDVYWQDSTTNWGIDLDKPIIASSMSIVNLPDEDISITFSISDNDSNLARARIDACRNTYEETSPPLLLDSGTRQYDLDPCDTLDWGTNNPTMLSMETGANLLGTAPINPSSNTYTIDGVTDSLIANLNGNENGSITFYLTFMDEGGNWAQENEILRLGEWAIVKGGLVFGERGVSSSTRELSSPDVWSDTLVLTNDPYNFEYDKIDISDRVLVGGRGATTNMMRFMVRNGVNSAFRTAKFSGIFKDSIYSDLVNAYKDKQAALGDRIETTIADGGNISGTLTSLFTSGGIDDLFFVESPGSITINSGFTCNAKGLIAASGNITLQPDFLNDIASNACIILADGDIIIQEGNVKTGSPIDYDIIEAFLIAGGEIRIEGDGSNNGLLVEGGMAAFNPTTGSASILNQRVMPLEYRHNYPVLAVKNNPKYGILSGDLFGSQASMFQVYIGFKPY